MFAFTHQLRITSAAGLNVTFLGYTLEAFKRRHVDPLEGDKTKKDPHSRHTKFERVMNNDLMDISKPVVQRALERSFIYARDAATQAAHYFTKRPGGLHRYADMAKIFSRHFKLDAPTDGQRDEVQRVLRLTAQGLSGALVICDLLAAKDGDKNSGLVDGAEGQVVFSAEEDARYMDALKNRGNERPADVTRRFLQAAEDPDIYIAFDKLKFWNVAQLARVIVHEATHKYAATGDYAYYSNAVEWNGMTGGDAIKNADSYAYASISVKASSALTPDKIARLEGALIPMRELQRIVPSLAPQTI
jgi:hypothetical protein